MHVPISFATRVYTILQLRASQPSIERDKEIKSSQVFNDFVNPNSNSRASVARLPSLLFILADVLGKTEEKKYHIKVENVPPRPSASFQRRETRSTDLYYPSHFPTSTIFNGPVKVPGTANNISPLSRGAIFVQLGSNSEHGLQPVRRNIVNPLALRFNFATGYHGRGTFLFGIKVSCEE